MARDAGFLDEVRAADCAVEHAGERMEELRREQKRLAADIEKPAAELTARRAGARRASWRSAWRPNWRRWPWSARCSAWQIEARAVVRDRRRPGGVSGVAQRGRRAQAARKGGLRRRNFAHRAGAQDLSGGAGATAAPRTLVFDEVDAGMGGSAAEGVGRRLKKLAAANQVLCVTHLAQIASFADHHYLVEKRESKGRTVAAIEELDGAARTREIGRMLSRPEADAGGAEARRAVDQERGVSSAATAPLPGAWTVRWSGRLARAPAVPNSNSNSPGRAAAPIPGTTLPAS